MAAASTTTAGECPNGRAHCGRDNPSARDPQMRCSDCRAEEAVETDTERDARALTRPMVVVEDDPAVWGDSEVAVYHEDRRHIVSPAAGFCDCADAHFRKVKCQHIRRAEFALGLRTLPAWVTNRDEIDPILRQKLEDQ